MAKTTLYIHDQTGKKVGTIFLDVSLGELASPGRSRGMFHSEVPTITSPRPGRFGAARDLFHFLKGGKTSIDPRANAVTVRVEEWDHQSQVIRLKDFDERITFNIVTQIAQMIAGGHDWTRGNLVKYTSMSENRTRLYVDEFKRLGYLEVSANNRSTVTHSGRLFLRGVMKTAYG